MKKRLYYIDFLRIFAAFFVVFMHVEAGAMRENSVTCVTWNVLAIISGIAFSAVPIFFMMSGYLLTASDNVGDVRVLLKHRLPRLVVPLVCWSALYILENALFAHDWSASFFGDQGLRFISSQSNESLWFMYILICMYIVSPVVCVGLKNLDRAGKIYVLVIVGLLMSRSVASILWPDFANTYLNIYILNNLVFFANHLCAFALGWIIGSSKRRIPKWILVLGIVVLTAIIGIGTITSSRTIGYYNNTFHSQNMGLEVALGACIFMLFKEIKFDKHPKLCKAAAYISPCTFAVYLMHNLVLSLMQKFICPLRLWQVAIVTIVLYILCMVAAWVLSRIPVLSYLFCGSKTKKSESEKSK